MSERDDLYVVHILECIAKINDFTKFDQNLFLTEELIQDAVLRNLQVLAESTKRLSTDLKQKFPDIRWEAIIGFRNLIVHDYLGVNNERVWQIIENELPLLKKRLMELEINNQ